MEKKLIIRICASKDSFGAYSENCDGIYAAGDTIAATKKDAVDAICIFKEENPKEVWPEPIKKGWPIEWQYDTQSLLKHYQGIFSNAALQRLTGINQKQLWNYANGVAKPRKEARMKIENALHSLGSELMQISL